MECEPRGTRPPINEKHLKRPTVKDAAVQDLARYALRSKIKCRGFSRLKSHYGSSGGGGGGGGDGGGSSKIRNENCDKLGSPCRALRAAVLSSEFQYIFTGLCDNPFFEVFNCFPCGFLLFFSLVVPRGSQLEAAPMPVASATTNKHPNSPRKL